jgi:hypothetical protein
LELKILRPSHHSFNITGGGFGIGSSSIKMLLSESEGRVNPHFRGKGPFCVVKLRKKGFGEWV